MAARARLWFLLPGGTSEEREALASALGQRSLAAIISAQDLASRASGERLSAVAGCALKNHSGLSASGALAVSALHEIARGHPGSEIAVAAPAGTLRAAAAACLGLELDAPLPIALRPGALFALDWPADAEGASAPVLVGADLDWLPPWSQAQARNPLPGGPGAAGTARG